MYENSRYTQRNTFPPKKTTIIQGTLTFHSIEHQIFRCNELLRYTDRGFSTGNGISKLGPGILYSGFQYFLWSVCAPKSTDFEQKDCPIAHGFQNGSDFGNCRESSLTHSKHHTHACKWFITSDGIVREDFARISNSPKSVDFEQKSMVYNPWF